MDRVVFVIIAVSVLLLAFAWASTRKESSTRSLQKFTVRISYQYRKVTLWIFSCFTGFVLIFSALYFLGAEFDIEILTMMAILAGLSFLFWAALSLKRLSANQSTLTYRNMLGIARKTSLEKIDKIMVEADKSLTIYVNGKVFANLGADYSHISNLRRLCERRDIPIQQQSERTLTKWTFLKKFALVALGIGAGTGIFVGVIVVPIYFIHGSFEGSLFDVILLIVSIWLGVTLIASAALLPISLRLLWKIAAQEKVLNFSFCQEMQSLNISKLNYESSDWFISLEESPPIVLRRDFVAKFENRKGITNNDSQIAFVDPTGKRRKVRGPHARIAELEKWILNN